MAFDKVQRYLLVPSEHRVNISSAYPLPFALVLRGSAVKMASQETDGDKPFGDGRTLHVGNRIG